MVSPTQSGHGFFVQSPHLVRLTQPQDLFLAVLSDGVLPSDGELAAYYSVALASGVPTKFVDARTVMENTADLHPTAIPHFRRPFDTDGAYFTIIDGADIVCCSWTGAVVFTQVGNPDGGNWVAGPVLAGGSVFWAVDIRTPNSKLRLYSRPRDGTGSAIFDEVVNPLSGLVDIFWRGLVAAADRLSLVAYYFDDRDTDFAKLSLLSLGGALGTTVSDTVDFLGSDHEVSPEGNVYGSKPSGDVIGFSPSLVRDSALDFPVSTFGITSNGRYQVVGDYIIVHASGTGDGFQSFDRAGVFAGHTDGKAARWFTPQGLPIIDFIDDAAHSTASDPYTLAAAIAFGPTAVTWSLDAAPAGATVDSGSGLVTWATTTVGVHEFTLRATVAAGFDLETWELTVT